MIESENCIVAFLDLLGYKQWLENYTPDEARKIILRHFNEIELGYRHESSPFRTFYKSISMHSLSDSLIIVMPDSTSLEHAFPGPDGKEGSKFACYQRFMGIVSGVAFLLISDSKLLVRGAITFGQYYQNELNGPQNQFIFSKALHKAATLERQAGTPRIIVEDAFMQKTNFIPHTFRDQDGQYCLDIYCVQAPMNLEFRKNLLSKITASLKEQLERVNTLDGSEKIKIQHKLFWFIEYHNRSIDELCKLKKINDKERFKIIPPPYLS